MQVPQELLESIGQTLVINAKSRHWEQFNPLDHDLGNSFFSELKEYFGIHLCEVY